MFAFLGMINLNAAEKKIALLFLTRSDLNHTELWKDWVIDDKYTIYNHPKTPVSDPWFSQFCIKQICQTSWANTMLAQQALLRAALKNPDNYKFIFLTESCAPLRTADQVYKMLTDDNNSHMAWKKAWWEKKDPRTLSKFPEKYHRGNYSWFVLNRKHAEMIANDNYWILLSNKHPIDNESYPSTFFCMMGVLDEINNVLTHFVDWQRPQNSGPYVFCKATQENLDILINVKKNYICPDGIPGFCLFARKFTPEFPIEALRQLQRD